MKITSLRRINKEDLQKAGGEIPPWLDTLVSICNDIFDRVTLTLRNNLTFTDNFLGRFVTLKLTHDSPLEIQIPTGFKASGVIPLYFGGLAMDTFGWSRVSNGNISVTIKFDGGISTTSAECTLQILYG